MASNPAHKRVHVGGQGTRMSRTCRKCRRPRPITGGSCQPGKPFICARCL